MSSENVGSFNFTGHNRRKRSPQKINFILPLAPSSLKRGYINNKNVEKLVDHKQQQKTKQKIFDNLSTGKQLIVLSKRFTANYKNLKISIILKIPAACVIYFCKLLFLRERLWYIWHIISHIIGNFWKICALSANKVRNFLSTHILSEISEIDLRSAKCIILKGL